MGDLAEELRDLFEEEGVAIAPQLAYPSEVTFPGEDLVVGAFVPGFADAWDPIVASWRSHEWTPPGDADRFHVETHVYGERDVFITDDRPLLVMCRRLREEEGVKIEAMTLAEFLARPTCQNLQREEHGREGSRSCPARRRSRRCL